MKLKNLNIVIDLPLTSIQSAFTITCQYPCYERIKLVLAAQGATIDGEEFGTEVTLKATAKEADFNAIAEQCRDISRGQAKITAS